MKVMQVGLGALLAAVLPSFLHAQEAKAPAPAASAAPGKVMSAQDIVTVAFDRNGSFYTNVKAGLRMTLTTAKGEQKVRDLEIRGIRTADGSVRTLVRFRSPADVAGTTFLVMQNPSGPPDQYLYLPNLKKVRRIAAGQASQSFMGSDFTFLDMSPVPAARADEVSYNRLPDAEIGGQPVYVVEVTPKLQGSPYSRVVVHVHKEHLIPLKVEFFDAVGAPLKTLSVKKLKKLKSSDGSKVVPLESEMRNLQKGSATVMSLEDVDLEAKLNPEDFTPAALSAE
ncbi:MAG: outer membrane lipoprotein-sorting protein [Myxococcota bacterium]